MRRVGLVLAILLATPAWAQARVHTIAPPGNSGVGQYLETVPTAGGGQPSDTVHPRTGGVGAGHSGRAGGPPSSGGPGPTGGSGGAGATGGSAGATIAPSTQRALDQQGPAGVAAAALAQATAPRGAGSPAPVDRAGPSSSVSAASSSDGSSPASSVFKAFTGSSSGGGLGSLLPIVLIGTVLAAAVLALVRRRRTS
jgi:hypothetical protein